MRIKNKSGSNKFCRSKVILETTLVKEAWQNYLFKHTNKPMKHNRKLSNAVMNIVNEHLTKVSRAYMRDGQYIQYLMSENDIHIELKETGPLSWTIHKNQPKINSIF